MDPSKIPLNALFVGSTNSRKTKYIVDQLRGPFRGMFDYIVLICPTFVHNETYEGFVDNDPRIFVINCSQHDVEGFLKLATSMNTLIILDDCAASKDAKGRTSQLVSLHWVQCTPYRHQHRETVWRKRRGDRSLLHPLE